MYRAHELRRADAPVTCASSAFHRPHDLIEQ
jgi:hypothetical protein